MQCLSSQHHCSGLVLLFKLLQGLGLFSLIRFISSPAFLLNTTMSVLVLVLKIIVAC